MANPELGTKRTCLQCGARFYDLDKAVIVCPKCGHEHTAELFARNRRLRSTAADAMPKPKRAPAAAVSPEAADEEADIEVEVEDEDEDEVFEDTADIGEDDEDVAEVIDKGDDDDPDR